MTWLYVPTISSPSAQASADSNWESSSLSIIGERLAEASATWRGKQEQPQVWSRRWKQGGFIRLLSGLTCSPSTLDHGVAQFISSLREIPARTTASLESAQGPAEIASWHHKSAASPKSAGLILSSAKTSRGMQTGSSGPSSRHWSGWVTSLRAEYSARPKLAIPCDASDCSSWPSAKVSRGGWERDRHGNVYPTVEGAAANWIGPSATDGRRGGTITEQMTGASLVQQVRFVEAASQWMAPNVPNGGRSTGHAEQIGGTLYHDGKKVQYGLEAQVKQWPGPQARDFKGVNQVNPLDYNSRPLNELASTFRPPSSLDQPIAGAAMSSTDSPNSNQPSVKRKLNPIFVEALMRWPTGLSGFERQEMAWTLWWLLMPSFLSQLCSASDTPAQHDMFGS